MDKTVESVWRRMQSVEDQAKELTAIMDMLSKQIADLNLERDELTREWTMLIDHKPE